MYPERTHRWAMVCWFSSAKEGSLLHWGELEIGVRKRTPDSSSSQSSIGDHLDFELDRGERG